MLILSLLFNIMGILVPSLVAKRVWQNWGRPVSLPLSLFMVTITAICILNIFSVTQFANQFLFHENTTLVISFTSTALWFWISYEFINKSHLPLKWIVAIFIEPVLMIIISYTNEFHGLFSHNGYHSEFIDTKMGTEMKFFRIMHLIYSVTIISLSIFWLIKHLYKNTTTHTLQLCLLVIVLILPMVAFFLHTALIIPMRIGAPLSVFLILLGVSRFRVLDIIPIAREQVVEHLNDAVITINSKGMIIDTNAKARDLFNFPSTKISYNTHAFYVPLYIKSLFKFSLNEIQRHEFDFSGKIDQILMSEIIFTPISKNNRTVDGGILMIRDITEHKQTIVEKQSYIQQIEQSRQHLQQLNQFKSEFLTNISHEFRTPITLSMGTINDIISGHFGVLPQSILPKMTLIKKHNHNLLRLINQLLTLSQLESTQPESCHEVVHWKHFLPAVIELFQELATKQKITLTLEIEANKSTVSMKEDEALTLINNLISNALKYTPHSGNVHVTLSNTNNHDLLLVVSDTGKGIKPNELPHIFERFHSDHSQHDLWSAGCGIGLALVKHIVENRQGQIQVESTKGVGSTFTITLPLNQDHCDDTDNGVILDINRHQSISPSVNNHNASSIQSDQQPSSILIIEDNHDMRDYIHLQLQSDFRVITAEGAHSGFKKAVSEMPDVIISDVMMPVMNGDKLCKKIKNTRQTSHIPVILLTADATHQQKIKGLTAQADDYLTKPFDTQELLIRIKNLIIQRQQLRRYYVQLFSDNNNCDLPHQLSRHSSIEEKFITSLKSFLSHNINNVNLQLCDMASHMCMSERQLQRKIKTLTDHSPVQLLQKLRIEMAAQMLLDSNISITEIVHQTGFNSSSYFAKIFKKFYLQAPTDYRINNSQGTNNTNLS